MAIAGGIMFSFPALAPRRTTLTSILALALGASLSCAGAASASDAPSAPAATHATVPDNVYAGTTAQDISPVVKSDPPRIYVPNLRSNDVTVIDPQTLKVIDTFKVGMAPQHVVPSWDLRTLWVANNAERSSDGSLTPIDPRTGRPGKAIPVDDPYNMYFTPDGRSAIVVAEARKRLDFRDPHTMALQYSIDVPECGGINHADFAKDGSYAIFTCEFNGSVAKIDLNHRKVLGYLTLTMPKRRYLESAPGRKFDPSLTEVCTKATGMPQDVRVSPDGSLFYIADMDADGLHVVDGASLKELRFIPTGVGAHGLYPSRDATRLYVANRGSHRIHGLHHEPGSIAVVDFASGTVIAVWPIPGGGSPDMGNVSADGRWLWLSGRFDDVVYRIDTSNGQMIEIKVGQEPHGLAVWPQPGSHSLGHTGVMR